MTSFIRLPKLSPSGNSTKPMGTYSPNKVGLLSSRLTTEKLRRSIALSRALMVAVANRDVFSATRIRQQMSEANDIALSDIKATFQNFQRKSTAHGDFTGCYRGGF